MYGYGIFAVLGRFDLGCNATDPSYATKFIIIFLPTPKMLHFCLIWWLLQISLIAADPFGKNYGNLDMAGVLIKLNHGFQRDLEDYFAEDLTTDHELN